MHPTPPAVDPRLTTLAAERLRALAPANAAFADRYLGPTDAPRAAPRHPVHVVYGGAHLFGAETFAKVGAVARAALERHAPDAANFAEVFGIDAALAEYVYTRVRTKLATLRLAHLYRSWRLIARTAAWLPSLHAVQIAAHR